jgi:hypothetical protein
VEPTAKTMSAPAGESVQRAGTLTSVREKWELETTARNLRLIREAREKRGDIEVWMKRVEDLLRQRAWILTGAHERCG